MAGGSPDLRRRRAQEHEHTRNNNGFWCFWCRKTWQRAFLIECNLKETNKELNSHKCGTHAATTPCHHPTTKRTPCTSPKDSDSTTYPHNAHGVNALWFTDRTRHATPSLWTRDSITCLCLTILPVNLDRAADDVLDADHRTQLLEANTSVCLGALREKQNSPSATCFPECQKSGTRGRQSSPSVALGEDMHSGKTSTRKKKVAFDGASRRNRFKKIWKSSSPSA
jgi:hypothetical protein